MVVWDDDDDDLPKGQIKEVSIFFFSLFFTIQLKLPVNLI